MELNVQLFIGQQKEVVLKFDRQLPVKLTGVKINEETHLLDLYFYHESKPDLEAHVELNCPVDSKGLTHILEQSHCLAGFFQEEQLVEMAYLPLLHKNSEFGDQGGVR